jgi:hypothetical protein
MKSYVEKDEEVDEGRLKSNYLTLIYDAFQGIHHPVRLVRRISKHKQPFIFLELIPQNHSLSLHAFPFGKKRFVLSQEHHT